MKIDEKLLYDLEFVAETGLDHGMGWDLARKNLIRLFFSQSVVQRILCTVYRTCHSQSISCVT